MPCNDGEGQIREGEETSFGQTDRLNFQKIKLPAFFSRPNVATKL